MSSQLIKSNLLQNKSKTIQRGAYWFGIVGRISIAYAMLNIVSLGLIFALNFYLQSVAGPEINSLTPYTAGGFESATSAVIRLIYGWLFLLGRDAFNAIELIISEMNDIV